MLSKMCFRVDNVVSSSSVEQLVLQGFEPYIKRISLALWLYYVSVNHIYTVYIEIFKVHKFSWVSWYASYP